MFYLAVNFSPEEKPVFAFIRYKINSARILRTGSFEFLGQSYIKNNTCRLKFAINCACGILRANKIFYFVNNDKKL